MAYEIEKKFLVKGEFINLATKVIEIIQRYLVKEPDKTIRIRIAGEKGWLTIKNSAREGSFTRNEWEIPLNIEDARELMNICLPGQIIKTRYLIPSGNHIFEVDVFHDRNEGLVIAEIELESEDEPFEKPEWLGEEVTGQKEYYNSWLAK